MKNECNVARDLMPLVIDKVASEESIQLVEEHVAACGDCAQAYEALQTEIHEEALAKEQQAFEQAAQVLKRRRKRRKLWVIFGSVIMTVLVLTLGGMAVKHLSGIYVMKDVDNYDVQLAQIKGTDQVVMLFTGVEGTGHGMYYDRTEDGMRLLVRADRQMMNPAGDKRGKESFMQYMHQCRLVDGHIIEDYQGVRTVTEVVLTDGETERVIYRDGDPIPLGSDELTAYYQAWESMAYSIIGESEEDKLMRRESVEQLKDLVPELN